MEDFEYINTIKQGDCIELRQMEWMGFYFEFLCFQNYANIIDMPGKKYGNTEFDAFKGGQTNDASCSLTI